MSPEAFEDLKYRRTGKSTRLALRTLLEALESPGKAIPVKDHFGSRQTDKMLFESIQDMAKRLDLEYLEFNRSNLTVRFTWKNPLL
jgi:hypothetical protein